MADAPGGRYLPETARVRADANFLGLALNPELAIEVTLQPVRRFGMDGAILFADILLIPCAGQALNMSGEGPRWSRSATRRARQAVGCAPPKSWAGYADGAFCPPT